MTQLDSIIRLSLYTSGNVVQAAIAGIVSVDFKDTKAVVVFVLGLLGVAITTVRTYIDKTPAEVAKTSTEPGAVVKTDTMKNTITLLLIAALCYAMTSCSGLVAGITGQPTPSTAVKREGGTPVNVATSDLLQAEVGPPEKIYGLYDVGAVAATVGKLSKSAKPSSSK